MPMLDFRCYRLCAFSARRNAALFRTEFLARYQHAQPLGVRAIEKALPPLLADIATRCLKLSISFYFWLRFTSSDEFYAWRDGTE